MAKQEQQVELFSVHCYVAIRAHDDGIVVFGERFLNNEEKSGNYVLSRGKKGERERDSCCSCSCP